MSIIGFGNPEARFWKWFQRRSERLFGFERDQDVMFEELTKELNRVNEGLTFEFGPVERGRREFIVSADGIKSVFPAVQKLVAAAPQMAEWEIIAFRPPKSLDYRIEIGELSIGVDDVWFRAEPDGEKVGLTLFLRGFSEDNKVKIGQALFLLLDNALGEYGVETRIGFVEIKPLPEKPEASGLNTFRWIRSAVPGLS